MYVPLALVLFVRAANAELRHPSIDLIGGRQVESVLSARPASKVAVIFENGSRATLDRWDKVLDALSPDVSVFAYNRPGYARSGAVDTPRDGTTIVEELRQVLKHKGLAPPYVLVGHSLGGLYMQLFARRYPDDVAGIVLVDALYPRMVKKTEDFPWSTRLAKRVFFSSTVNREIDNIYVTGEQVLALPGIDNKPMVKLFNRPTSVTAIPVDFGAFNLDPQTRELVLSLYPKARKIVVDSDHQMQTATPEAVVEAIRSMLREENKMHL